MGQLYWAYTSQGHESTRVEKAEDLEGMLRHTLVDTEVQKLFFAMLYHAIDEDSERAYETIKDVDYKTLDRDEHWLMAITTLVDIAVGVGDLEMMEWLDGALCDYADLIAVHDLLRAGRGSVASSLGMLCRGLGDLDRSVTYFERAIELEEAADMQTGLAVSRLGLVAALEDRDGPGDATRIPGLLNQAIEIVGALGLGPKSRVVRSLVKRGRLESEAITKI